MLKALALVAVLAVASVAAIKPFEAPNSSYPTTYYGYVPISTQYDSAMFYAIRSVITDDAARAKAPLVFWLQGGPGASSMFGDFLESGPIKVEKANNTEGYNLVPRASTWAKHATMVYVDNPVGTGFSYTKDPKGFSTTDVGIADNLVTFLKGFLAKHPEYNTNQNDFWVFCESYGGKMTAYFGAAIVDAIQAKQLTVNFKGVALGDGWVDPIGCMYSYGDYLKGFSQLTQDQVDNVTMYAKFAQSALEEGRGFDATNWWSTQQEYISLFSANVNWYNDLYYYDYTAEAEMDKYVAGPFTQQLGSLIPEGVSFNKQSGDVFTKMGGSFMNDGISQVVKMLDAGYEVNVYGGQLDLIVDVLCIEGWIAKMPWSGLSQYKTAPRKAMYPPGAKNVGLFRKGYANFNYWQVMRAGHMVPLDNPSGAELMMTTIVGGDVSRVAPEEPTVLHKEGRKHQGRYTP